MTGAAARPADHLRLTAPDGMPEVRPGDDLAALVAALVSADLHDGDVVVVTSKVVSKSEGRAAVVGKDQLLEDETDRVVARRGRTSVVRTRQGLVMAAAGIDASNTEPGTLLMLPRDPDGSARRLREQLQQLTGRNAAVVVSDTAGRAWRTGQTDIAVGAAGLPVVLDHAGRRDTHGNRLVVTAPAVADEVAGAADLVKGKTAGRPVAVVRGLAHLVLPVGEHGPGASALVRPEAEDMFGLGAREAVLAALAAEPGEPPRGFGAPAPPEEVAQLLTAVLGGASAVSVEGDEVVVPLPSLDPRALGRWEARLAVAAVAVGWTVPPTTHPGGPLRLRSRHP